MAFAAIATLILDRRSGPNITDPQHIANWLTSESAEVGAGYGYLTLRMCSGCPDPEDCEPGCPAPGSTFRVLLSTVDSIEAD